MQRGVVPSVRILRVSVLFSEPKIPQCFRSPFRPNAAHCFSALQRAENSSMVLPSHRLLNELLFQCSSASRKFLNCGQRRLRQRRRYSRFSALQRAENSSIRSRRTIRRLLQRFSALQRAENSSMHGVHTTFYRTHDVSVLFSEPKIPQYHRHSSVPHAVACFSALQRAENSSIWRIRRAGAGAGRGFSALQRAENSSMPTLSRPGGGVFEGFSALQRAENSSMRHRLHRLLKRQPFQCSSASRKFLNRQS